MIMTHKLLKKKVGIVINAISKFIKIIDILRPRDVKGFDSKAPAVRPIAADIEIHLLFLYVLSPHSSCTASMSPTKLLPTSAKPQGKTPSIRFKDTAMKYKLDGRTSRS